MRRASPAFLLHSGKGINVLASGWSRNAFIEKEMSHLSKQFQDNITEYRLRLEQVQPQRIMDTLGLISTMDDFFLRFFDQSYSLRDIQAASFVQSPAEYMFFVILAKYLLLSPDHPCLQDGWAAFKDFKDVSHFTNVRYFTSDTEGAVEKCFSGRAEHLRQACISFGGRLDAAMSTAYDVAMQFDALPRISLLLLFNDKDDDFPAKCSLLFSRHAEKYLDPESLAMTGAYLVTQLRRIDEGLVNSV